MPALAVQQPYYINQKQKATIYNFPKQKTLRCGKSTEMECLYNKDEILSVYNVFKTDVDNATTVNKEKNAMRNLTMFICAINIGLRGGDFCKLTWKDVYEDGWRIKKSQKFVPEKTERRDRCGNVIKRKYVKLRYDSDFKMAIQNWHKWLEDHNETPELTDYIFSSNKGEHIGEMTWYRTVERNRIKAGIKQSIGTHGLRKTFGHSYYLAAPDKQQALIQLMTIFGHADMRITLRYICITDEEIFKNQERMCIFSNEEETPEDYLCPQDDSDMIE